MPNPEELAKVFMPIIEASDFINKMNNPPLFKDAAIQEKLLGEFNNKSVQLPLTIHGKNHYIAMQLATLNEDLWAQDVKEYVDQTEKGIYGDVLLKVMGAGKTARLYAMSTRTYMIYIACAKKDDRQSAIFDSTIAMLFKNLEEMADIQRICEAKREVLIYYLSRIIYLYALLKIQPTLTPYEFAMYQLNGFAVYIEEFYETLHKHLNTLGTSESAIDQCIKKVISLIKMGTPKSLAIAIDELQITAELMKGR